jgi:hypothetical protein
VRLGHFERFLDWSMSAPRTYSTKSDVSDCINLNLHIAALAFVK